MGQLAKTEWGLGVHVEMHLQRTLCYSCNFSISLNVFQNNKNTFEIRKSWGTFRCSSLFEKLEHIYTCMHYYFKITFPAHVY